MKIPVLIILLCAQHSFGNGTYRFFREMDKKTFGTRRIFGGDEAKIEEFPGTCLLTDVYLSPKCTGTIITPKFLVTAAHCLKPDLHYVVYNTRDPKKNNDKATIARVFRHPGFTFEIKDEGRGDDVVKLQHDIGLAKTKKALLLAFPARRTMDLPALRTAGAEIEYGSSDVKILGFGRTTNPNAEELLKVNLRTVFCDRDTFLYCACGQSIPGQRSRGVCTGDSGGPVVFNNTLLGVTSMGPMECSSNNDPGDGATTVFTLVSRYVDMIEDTIQERTTKPRMNEVLLNNAYTNNNNNNQKGGGGHSNQAVITRNALKIIYLLLLHSLIMLILR